ncbi:LacI family DNA-binding transcriptional regulator [Aestuariivirga sp.]|uniref:LacI family DNA-binding transcriptional regulator n=1 Tax=Aestuariivirga sp. TaxID=2650926 RepID=UPI003BA9B69F
MTTLVEVARRAGVSKSTVSNVIQGSAAVAEATRKRVEKAIRETGYRPNAIARSLRARTSHSIGMIVPDLSNPFHAALSVAVERAAKRHGYATLVAHTDCAPDIEIEVSRALFERRVDAVVIAGLSTGSDMPVSLLDNGIPVVLASFGGPSDQRLGSVDHDDIAAMESVVDHLFALGHRKFTFVSQSYAEQSGERRRQGFELALKRRGLVEVQRAQATAVVAHNDLIALDLIDEIERGGRMVPQDVSVTGHDDIPLAAHSRIRLTTVRSDATFMGERAIELVMRAMQAGGHVAHREIYTNPLVVRHTTGAAPQ